MKRYSDVWMVTAKILIRLGFSVKRAVKIVGFSRATYYRKLKEEKNS